MGLLRLSYFRDDPRLLGAAERTLEHFASRMAAQPFAFAHMVAVADLYLRKPHEIVVVGRRDEEATRAILDRLNAGYRPNTVLILSDPDAGSGLPIAEGKTQVSGQVTTYVCRDRTCGPPATEWPAVAEQLGEDDATPISSNG
jgi:uncharacterized protein YyaL (SSP411 family)